MREVKTQSENEHRFYVWFDTEYSSLELESAWLLQVAVLITDTSLQRVLPQEHDLRLTIRLPDSTTLSPWVEQNLPELVRACRSPGAVDIPEADRRLALYVDAVTGPPDVIEKKRPVLAGNSIHEDRVLIRRFLPRFLSRLNYRHLDVTTLKLEWKLLQTDKVFDKGNPEMIRQYFPEALLPASDSRHDAYYDLQASIAELAFYRRHLFYR
jgi:oligoribonuclease